MSDELLLNMDVTTKEADILISGLSEFIYKDVYKAIDFIRHAQKQNPDASTIEVRMDIEQAKKALTSIVKKPFCEVYELVGKINEQLQMKMLQAQNKSEKVEDVNHLPGISQANTPQPTVEIASKSLGNNGGASEAADRLGRPLHKEMLDRLSMQRRSNADS